MGQASVTCETRRSGPSRPGWCAVAALAATMLVSGWPSAAQDLRLQPTDVVVPVVPDERHLPDDVTLPPEPVDDQLVGPRTPPQTGIASPDSVAPPVSNHLAAALARPGDLNLHDTPLRAALFMISEQWGINVVAGEVEGSVNGVFRQAPLREILDSILLSNGYNYRAVGESLVISSVKDLGQTNPFFESATIPVQSADIDEVVQGAKLLTTPQGQVTPMKSARSIVVLDFPDRVKMIREFVTTIDQATRSSQAGGARAGQPLDVGHFHTQHVPAKAAEEALQAVLSKDGRVAVMEHEDRLVVADYPENLAMVEKVLEKVDRPRPQVRITALIYDISLEDLEQLGIRWSEFGYQSAGSAFGVGAGTQTLGAGVEQGDVTAELPGGINLAFGAFTNHLDIRGVAAALQTAKDARLLANPSVAVLDNEEAIFQSVAEIPFQQLTQTQQGGQIGTTAFKDAGITLRVRPKIACDSTIRMAVAPEFSRLTGFTPGDNQPIIDRRTASTTLSVANRQTVAIGGLRQRQDIGDFTGIPVLMDMKYVGKFFRSRETNVRESELVVFIMPEIIGTAAPLNHREALIVDTVGCRLNQIPPAEGGPPCGPPCGCGPIGYGPVGYGPVAGPVRLPPTTDALAVEPAVPPPATAPASATPESTPLVAPVATSLFDAPPVDLAPYPAEGSPARTGGFIEVGSGPRGYRR